MDLEEEDSGFITILPKNKMYSANFDQVQDKVKVKKKRENFAQVQDKVKVKKKRENFAVSSNIEDIILEKMAKR